MADRSQTTEQPPCGWNPATCYVDCIRRHLCAREARERQIEARGGLQEEMDDCYGH